VRTPGNALSSTNLASLDSYIHDIQNIPGVLQVESLVTVSPSLYWRNTSNFMLIQVRTRSLRRLPHS
ncbi:MAG: hypothetical protein ABI406_08705, partial [Ktedonobacteraceae bacterium]